MLMIRVMLYDKLDDIVNVVDDKLMIHVMLYDCFDDIVIFCEWYYDDARNVVW